MLLKEIFLTAYNNGEQYESSKISILLRFIYGYKKSIYCPCGKEIKSARGGG